jgi:hypothetical protein
MRQNYKGEITRLCAEFSLFFPHRLASSRKGAIFRPQRLGRLTHRRTGVMRSKLLLIASTIAIAAATSIPMSIAARAQDRAAEIVGFHQLCDRGDRKACIRFGMLLGQNMERHAEWRRSHPEWWWWEH